jgi:signal transduction histidine kinase
MADQLTTRWQRALKNMVRGLLGLSTFRFALLFMIVAVSVSVMIVLVIDLLWDGRLNTELQFAGVLTPFLDGLLLVGFVVAMLNEIREEVGRRKRAEADLETMNEALETRVAERTQQLFAAQEELVRKEKLALLGQVADNVGHELRNPLGVMNNAVYYLQTVLADADDTTREYLGIIKDEIADAERIVSDLLDAVRTKPPQPEAVIVAELLDKTLRKCDVPASVTVRQDIPTPLATVRADPAQMHQVLWNLITNALEAMPEGGTLGIKVEDDVVANEVRIGIRDGGSGMSPEQLGKLFQPMYTTKARRVGLGLMVVKNLTQANGGRVDVRSEPAKGSTFVVSLPRASAQ